MRKEWTGPEKLLNTASLLPGDDFRKEIAEVAVQRIMGADPNAVGKWLTVNTDSPLYDQVTATFAVSVTGLDTAQRISCSTRIAAGMNRGLIKKLRTKPGE